jgi:hypothetical protein
MKHRRLGGSRNDSEALKDKNRLASAGNHVAANVCSCFQPESKCVNSFCREIVRQFQTLGIAGKIILKLILK